MLVVDNGDAIRGKGSVASKLDYTVHGYVGTTATQLADGQLGNSEADMYLSGADSIVVLLITVVNTDTSARTVDLYLKPSGGTSRQFGPKACSLAAGYSLATDGMNTVVTDTSGQIMASYGAHAASHTDGTDDIQDAAADGSTKGIATFTAAHFDDATGVISLEAGLANLAAVAMAADKFYYTSGDNVHVAGDVTAFARSILDDADEATFKATVNLEIGTDVLAEQTIGIADNNLLEVDGSPNSGEVARFTANGLEGLTEAEFKTAFNLESGVDFQAYDAGLTDLAGVAMAADKFYYTSGDNTHVAGDVSSFARTILDDANAAAVQTTLGLVIGTDVLAEQTIGIADDNLVEVDDADAADDDYAKFTANGLEGRSYAEVLADIFSVDMPENLSMTLDDALSADGKWCGTETEDGTAGAALSFGQLCYFAVADSRWELTDADAEATAKGKLGFCILAAVGDGSATKMLFRGKIRADAQFPALTVGAEAWVGTTAGAIQVAAPSGSGDIVRCVGHANTANELAVNISPVWLEIA